MTLEEIDAQPDFIKDRMKSSEELDKRFRQGGGKPKVTSEDSPF